MQCIALRYINYISSNFYDVCNVFCPNGTLNRATLEEPKEDAPFVTVTTSDSYRIETLRHPEIWNI